MNLRECTRLQQAEDFTDIAWPVVDPEDEEAGVDKVEELTVCGLRPRVGARALCNPLVRLVLEYVSFQEVRVWRMHTSVWDRRYIQAVHRRKWERVGYEVSQNARSTANVKHLSVLDILRNRSLDNFVLHNGRNVLGLEVQPGMLRFVIWQHIRRIFISVVSWVVGDVCVSNYAARNGSGHAGRKVSRFGER